MHEPIQLIYGLHNMYLYIRPEQGHHSKTTNTLFRYSYSYDNESTQVLMPRWRCQSYIT